MKNTTLDRVLSVLRLSEQLKRELRHSWLADGRQESVAEHSWRLALMVLILEPILDQPFDLLKALKMALIHDLVEAEVGDIPVFELDEKTRKMKSEREALAMRRISAQLGSPTGETLSTLWEEFELGQSYESKLVSALDKLECKLQHIEADVSTWNEKERALSFDWEEALYDFDSCILELSRKLKLESKAKVDGHNELKADCLSK